MKNRATDQQISRSAANMEINSSFKNLLLCCSVVLLLCCSVGCASVSIDQQREADFHHKMGISYLNEGNIQMAFVQLQKAFQLNPDNKEILNSLGLIYLQLEEFEKAKSLFHKAVSIDPKFSDAHHNMGVAYINTRQVKEAIESFQEALSNPLYQTPEKSFYLLGLSYYRLNQFEPAINAFKDSIKRAPLFAFSYYGLALAYNKIERYGDAASIITRAIEIDPSYKGDRASFIEAVKKRLLTAKDEEESDLRDYLEIMRY